jgi:N-methylhydantoinase A
MSEQAPGICIGIDVGGTFTDCVLTEGTSTWRAKAPSTPGELGRGVLAAATLAAERRGASFEETIPHVARFGLGTTAVTNALASRTGRKVGLLATAGFEDMLRFGRGRRVVNDDGWLVPPEQIVDDDAVVGIHERIDRDGAIVTPLDATEVEQAARRLVEEGVEAIAVSFLWSFLNPTHEEQAVAAVRLHYPDLTVVSAAELHPLAREYERTTFAVLNAHVSVALDGIEELEAELDRLGFRVPLLLVHSGGGSITVAEARRRPLGLAVSGPAAGVAASAVVAEAARVGDVITCDMGGTSFDVSVVRDATPARRTRGYLAGIWTALSLVDVESIGAGGGSLGWVDARGMLRVGPRSAGSQPGPACYGRGGDQATVTDALVVLGYIDATRFLGGDFDLDADAAFRACAALGAQLGIDAEEAAWGIRRLALAGMAKATRARTAALGLDPRDHALLSFGGSGSLFTPEIATAVGARRVVVPDLASVLSAFGAATTDIRRERIRSVMAPVPVALETIEKITTELADAVRGDLAADGVLRAQQEVVLEADLKFARQTHEITVPLAGDGAYDVVEAFRDEYAKRYGKGSIVLGAPIEMVALRAVGIGRTTQARLARLTEEQPAEEPATPVGERSVRIERESGGRRDVPVFDESALLPGHVVAGPALVDGSDTTIWVPPDATGRVDPFGSFVMEVC